MYIQVVNHVKLECDVTAVIDVNMTTYFSLNFYLSFYLSDVLLRKDKHLPICVF